MIWYWIDKWFWCLFSFILTQTQFTKKVFSLEFLVTDSDFEFTKRPITVRVQLSKLQAILNSGSKQSWEWGYSLKSIPGNHLKWHLLYPCFSIKESSNTGSFTVSSWSVMSVRKEKSADNHTYFDTVTACDIFNFVWTAWRHFLFIHVSVDNNMDWIHHIVLLLCYSVPNILLKQYGKFRVHSSSCISIVFCYYRISQYNTVLNILSKSVLNSNFNIRFSSGFPHCLCIFHVPRCNKRLRNVCWDCKNICEETLWMCYFWHSEGIPMKSCPTGVNIL